MKISFRNEGDIKPCLLKGKTKRNLSLVALLLKMANQNFLKKLYDKRRLRTSEVEKNNGMGKSKSI